MPLCPSPSRSARLAALASMMAVLAACGGGGGGGGETPVAGTPPPAPAPSPAPAPPAPAPTPPAPAPAPTPPAPSPAPAPAPTPAPPAPAPAPAPTGVPNAPTGSLLSSQAAAAALVQDVRQRTRDLRLANGLTAGAQTSTTGGGLGLDLSVVTRKQALAAIDYTATLCSTGRATLNIPDAVLDRFAANPNAQLQVGDTIGLSSTACVVKAAVNLGAVALGDFGVGDRTSGSFVLQLVRLQGSDVVFELRYTDFTYQPFGGVAFDPLDALVRFGTENGVPVYTLDLPDTRFLTAPRVTTSQNLVFVNSGSLRGRLPPASGEGFGDYDYRNWTFDGGTLQASSGSVTVTGAANTLARITAQNSGYSVEITVSGSTRSFTIPR